MNYDAYKAAGSSPPKREPDFQLIRQSTIFLLEPLTAAARAWVNDHIGSDAMQFGTTIVVEHRYIADIVAGICAAGLVVE